MNAIAGESRPQINQILTNVKQVTEDVRKMTSTTEGGAGKQGELKSAAGKLDRAAGNLESMLDHANKVVERVRQGPGQPRLPCATTRRLMNEVETVVEDVGDLVGGIGRIQTVVGLHADYNFLANTIKSYVELRLVPSEDKYYDIELISDPRGKTSITQTDYDTTDPNEPSHYRTIEVQTTNSFRFLVPVREAASGPFTGRFGIKRSRRAASASTRTAPPRRSPRDPARRVRLRRGALTFRWRVAVAYEFIRKLWLLGGVDDILNSDRRDYFVGLQLRFNDQDLKTILPFAGGLGGAK